MPYVPASHGLHDVALPSLYCPAGPDHTIARHMNMDIHIHIDIDIDIDMDRHIDIDRHTTSRARTSERTYEHDGLRRGK